MYATPFMKKRSFVKYAMPLSSDQLVAQLHGGHHYFKDTVLIEVTLPSRSLLSPLALGLLHKLTPAEFSRTVLSLLETHFSLIL